MKEILKIRLILVAMMIAASFLLLFTGGLIVSLINWIFGLHISNPYVSMIFGSVAYCFLIPFRTCCNDKKG